MTQNNTDWESFLKETAADSTPATFSLTPDESVENPEAHVQKVKFIKTPAFLWMLATGGFVGLVLFIYGISSYVTNAKQVAASAPTDANAFDENPKKELLPRTPDEPTLDPIAPNNQIKKDKKKSSKGFDPRRTTPERVVYVGQRSYPSGSVYGAPRSVSQRSVTEAASPAPRPAAMRPVQPAQPEPELLGALYAPESGEGPSVDTAAIATAPSRFSQSSSPAIDQALTIYDGNEAATGAKTPGQVADATTEEVSPSEESRSEPIEVNPPRPVVAMGDQPLTSAEYEKKFPQRAAQERIMARLAIPAETTLKGQTMGMLTWASRESFPIGEEIRIQIKSDFSQDDKVVIPKGSVAIAQTEKGTMGQYIMANVTRIETPSGESFSVPAGMLTASTSGGFIEGKLKEPKRGGGAGRVFSRLGRSIATLGVASVLPQGDRFSDRVIQNVAAEGLDTLDGALDDDRNSSSRSQTPSFYVIKPKTFISLVANGDIELQRQNY